MLIPDSSGEIKPDLVFTLPAAWETGASEEGRFMHEPVRIVLDPVNPAPGNDFPRFMTPSRSSLPVFRMAGQT